MSAGDTETHDASLSPTGFALPMGEHSCTRRQEGKSPLHHKVLTHWPGDARARKKREERGTVEQGRMDQIQAFFFLQKSVAGINKPPDKGKREVAASNAIYPGSGV